MAFERLVKPIARRVAVNCAAAAAAATAAGDVRRDHRGTAVT